VVLLVVALAGALGLALCLPWLAERLLGRHLESWGIGNVTLGVRALSWREAVLGPLAIREEDGLLWVESVVVRYDLRRLLEGTVDEVRLTGARLPLVRRGGSWVPVGLETVRRLAARGGAGAGQTASPGPFQAAVGVRSSQLELRVPGGAPVIVPVEGTARLALPGESRLQGQVTLQGDPVGFRAVANLATGDGAVTSECDRGDVLAWAQAAARLGMPVPDAAADVSGTAAWQLDAQVRHWGLAGATAEGVVSELVLCREPVPLRLREGTVSLRCGPGLGDLRAEFSGQTEAVQWRGFALDPFACSGTWAGDTVEVDIRDAAWRFGTSAKGRARGRLVGTGVTSLVTAAIGVEAALSEVQLLSRGPLSGHLDIAGTLADLRLKALLESERPEAASGLATVVLDAHVRRGESTEIEAAGTAIVCPQSAVQAAGLDVAVACEPVPVGICLAARLHGAEAWEGSGTVTVPAHSVRVEAGMTELAGELGLECDFAVRAVGLSPWQEAWECSGTAMVPLRQLRLEAEALRAAADANLECSFVAAPAGVTLAGQVTTSGVAGEASGAVFSAATAALALDSLRWERHVSDGAPSPPWWSQVLEGLAIEARATLRGAALSLPDDGPRCEGISLALPFAWDPERGLHERPGMAPGADCLRTGALGCRELAGASFRGGCSLAGQSLRVRGQLEGTAPQVTVDLEQTLDWGRGFAATLRYAVPAFRLDSEETWCRKLLGRSGVQLSGMVSAEGEVTLDGRGLRTPVRVGLADGSLSLPQKRLSVQGLRAEVQVVDALALRTAPFQEVRFDQAKASDIVVEGGRIVFQLDGPASLCLERCELNWCGGEVHTEAMRIDPRRAEFDLVLFAENVQVERVLQLVKGLSGKATGILSGKLPLSYRNGRLTYAKGYLYSVPGRTGTLKLHTGGLLSSAVGPDHPAYGELQRAEKALEDFRLDLFRLDFTGKQAGEPGATLMLVGEGAGERVPVTLNLNLKGAIEEALNVGLRLGGL
jgi:hypothetical protein